MEYIIWNILYIHILYGIEAAMAQQIKRTDLRSRAPGFDSGLRPNVFYLSISTNFDHSKKR